MDSDTNPSITTVNINSYKSIQVYNFETCINGNVTLTQAQQVINQDINMEDVLKMMCTIEGASEYVVTNSEGKAVLI